MRPPLREELVLHAGPRGRDGAPTWSLHDPVRNAFFSLDWLTFEILSRWHLSDDDALLASLAADTPLQAEAEDVEAVEHFVLGNELAQNFTAAGTAWYAREAQRRRPHLLMRLLHGYLFFRVPLWRPDAWLERALPWVAPLYSRGFLAATLLALLVGLVETSRQWETFLATLVDTVSLEGLAGFLAALAFAKVLHELGHAFTAKRTGCRVPTIGVAFLVLFPMAYTDVTEVWKLRRRGQRLAVGAAGILTELALAAWATLLWSLLPDGGLRDAVFLLATTTWITTLLVNASPFMRFDGYFLLMDWLAMPNLHHRAFDLARWRLREVLFGLGDPPPEPLPQAHRQGLVLFAYVIWLYRLVLFGGIAALVYSVFPKPVGPALAAIEVWWFILAPIVREMRAWGSDRERLGRARRLRLVGLGLLVVLAAGAVPWDGRIHGQAMLAPAAHFPIIVPQAAQVVAQPFPDGAAVKQGDLLFELVSPDLDVALRQKEIAVSTARWQSMAAGVSEDLRERRQVIEATRSRLGAELVAAGEERDRFLVRAPADGVLRYAEMDLRPGLWLRRDEKIASLIGDGPWQAVTYLAEADVSRIAVGDEALMIPEDGVSPALSLTVSGIDRDATRLLSDGALASTRGGRVLTRETDAGAVPEAAVYRVVLTVAEPDFIPPGRFVRGRVVVFGRRKAPLADFARAAAALVVREAGF